MPSYGDDIKNAHISKIGKYGEWSGQREKMLGDKSKSNWIPSGFYPMLKRKRHPKGPESVDNSVPKSGSGHYGAMVPACMHAALIQL
jgi:hypothetical protein